MTDVAASPSTPSPSSKEVDFKAFVVEKLRGLFFSGKYVDRTLVEEVGSYRDRVVVNPEESTAIKIIKSVFKKCKGAGSGNLVGIKRIEDEISIFVLWKCGKLKVPPPLGNYWFLVHDVVFHGAGFDAVLVPLRSKEQEERPRTCPNCRARLDKSKRQEDPNDTTTLVEFKEWILNSQLWLDLLTFENFKNGCKLVFLMSMAALAAILAFIKNLLPLLNRCLLSLGVVIQKSTPFLLACLDSFNKIIGATFLMINRIWSDVIHAVKTAPAPQKKPAVTLKGAKYWSRQEINSSENSRTGNLYLKGPGEGGAPRYPYLRRDINRPYMQDH